MKTIIQFFGAVLLMVSTIRAGTQTLSRSVIGATGSIHPQLSYTTGEVAIATGTAAGSVFTQGFQQPDAAGNTGGTFCNLPAIHVIDADNLQNGSYRAANSITLQNGSLQNGDDVSLSAGNTIQILPGFIAPAGSKLYAYIEACTEAVLSLPVEETSEVAEVINAFDQQEIQLRSFPNPFRESTTIEYFLPEASPVFLTVTDLNGQVVARLEDGVEKEAGLQRLSFSNPQLQAGMYILLLRTEAHWITKKLFFLR